MDQHGEKEAEDHSQDSKEQREGGTAAAGEEDDTPEASMEHRAAGYKAAESAGLLNKEVVGSGEASSPALFLAHPCSLLQLLLRACAGCLGLHGDCGSDDPKPAAVAAPDAAAAAAANDSSQGEEGGDKANNYIYMQGTEVVTRVWAVRRPPPPSSRPREGSGGNGGSHN